MPGVADGPPIRELPKMPPKAEAWPPVAAEPTPRVAAGLLYPEEETVTEVFPIVGLI